MKSLNEKMMMITMKVTIYRHLLCVGLLILMMML